MTALVGKQASRGRQSRCAGRHRLAARPPRMRLLTADMVQPPAKAHHQTYVLMLWDAPKLTPTGGSLLLPQNHQERVSSNSSPWLALQQGHGHKGADLQLVHMLQCALISKSIEPRLPRLAIRKSVSKVNELSLPKQSILQQALDACNLCREPGRVRSTWSCNEKPAQLCVQWAFEEDSCQKNVSRTGIPDSSQRRRGKNLGIGLLVVID
jgi:hypothetical protein